MVSPNKRLGDRDAGARFFEAVHRGDVDVVIASKLDRFARSTIGGLLDMKDLHDAGAGLVILDMGGETLDTTTSSGRLHATMMLAFAEFERGRIAERMETGRYGKASDGYWSGGVPPLGYVTESTDEGSVLVIEDSEDGEASTVRRIFGLLVEERLLPGQVAKLLTAEGRKTKRGGSWRHVQVVETVRRPIYMGDGIAKTHQGERHIIPAPAIVAPSIWESANELLDQRAGRKDADRRGDVDRPKGWRYGLTGRAFHQHPDGVLVKLYGETKKGLRRYRCSEAVSCPGFGVARVARQS